MAAVFVPALTNGSPPLTFLSRYALRTTRPSPLRHIRGGGFFTPSCQTDFVNVGSSCGQSAEPRRSSGKVEVCALGNFDRGAVGALNDGAKAFDDQSQDRQIYEVTQKV